MHPQLVPLSTQGGGRADDTNQTRQQVYRCFMEVGVPHLGRSNRPHEAMRGETLGQRLYVRANRRVCSSDSASRGCTESRAFAPAQTYARPVRMLRVVKTPSPR